jgi:hypothetical protein
MNPSAEFNATTGLIWKNVTPEYLDKMTCWRLQEVLLGDEIFNLYPQ